MKKLYLVPILFLLFSLNVFAGTFPDVPSDYKNYQAIEYLSDKGIIKGYEDGTFGPEKLVNRAEAVKMIVAAMNIKTEENYTVGFPDVKKDDWFFKYVMAGKTAGIIGGYKDNTFKPTNPVNLVETLKILLTAAKIKIPVKPNLNVFTDVEKDTWFAPYAQYARDYNILISDDYGAVHPNQSMTRASFAELVYRMMVVADKKGQPFPLEMNWSLYTSTNLPFSIKYDAKNWKVIADKSQVIFLKPDKQYSQYTPNRIYPNTALVSITLDPNEGNMVAEQYFTNIKNAFPNQVYKKFSLSGLSALEVINESSHIEDWYIYLKNNQVLSVYSQFGNGALSFQLQQILKSMMGSISYKEVSKTTEDYSELLSAIFSKVLVKNKGMSALDTLPEKSIIQTDTLGAGNGPVDYYYSQKLDYSFKYERNDDVILDSRKGKLSTF